jgi:hypothetical protein
MSSVVTTLLVTRKTLMMIRQRSGEGHEDQHHGRYR